MKRIVRLTESDLTRIVRRVITESKKEYRVVLLPKKVYDETSNVDEAIKQFSEETDGKTFEHKGSALRHAETLYDENPDNEIMFVVVDENNEGYGAVPGIIDSPISRFATGFSKGY
jgi:AICAR transformylase/IMP cyclohydrolase PurH